MAKIFFRTNHSTKLLIKDNGDCKVTNCSPNPKDIEKLKNLPTCVVVV